MSKKQYYYHITQKISWGNEIILFPKSYGKNRSDGEIETPRICVSPTIEGCLVALGDLLNINKPIYIYRTKYKVQSSLAKEINDASITGEKWMLRPTIFICVGKINKKYLPENFFDMSVGCTDGRTRRKQFTMRKKLERNKSWMQKKLEI